MTMPDDESMYEYYADPDNRVPAGAVRRRVSKPLSTHVPIRFTPDVIAEVKKLADKDHKSVSSWIRHVVEEEVERRQPRIPHSVGTGARVVTHWLVSSAVAINSSESSTVPTAIDLGVGS
jgi:hypothetical protein